MLFTVAGYLLVLKQEMTGHRVDMTKKDFKNNTLGGDDNQDDDPENEKTVLFFGQKIKFLSVSKVEHYFFVKQKTYNNSVSKINSPPPKI